MSSIHILREQIVLNRMFGVELPSGTVAIRFSLDNVHTDLSGLRPGNRVDVIVGMQYVPVNDNFQTLQANGEPVQALEADGEQEPKLLMQRVISGAQILIVESEDWITLAVGSEEAVLMRWVAEAQLPLLLARA
jgi:hypothetical protein